MIQRERIRPLNNEAEKRRDYVLYWMQASQRAEDNHALEYAATEANARRRPLVVFFGLTDKFPEANERHYVFMLEGLREVAVTLERRGIRFVVMVGFSEISVAEMARRACLVVVDRGYLRIERQWRAAAAQALDCPLIQVETNVVIPLEQASAKEEFAARTIRPKIQRQLEKYLIPLKPVAVNKDSLGLKFESLNVQNPAAALSGLDIDRSVGPVRTYIGGTTEARKRLAEFIDNNLSYYPERRNDPNENAVSNLSPYLHFGQISPLAVGLEVSRWKDPAASAYLEELIVRRELSMNFVYYNTHYDQFAGLPFWAQKTLKEHQGDKREAIYSLAELEASRTADAYWNAAQREMVVTGKMHNYMRMYWGKRIIEWTRSPEEAYRLAIYLNNKYEIDGRDPNSFAGVGWCFGLHDRPWPTHRVFGKVRMMTDSGLRRKFDADSYAKKYEVNHGRI